MTTDDPVRNLVRRIVAAHPQTTAPEGPPDFGSELWDALESHGLTTVSVPEARGGAGAGLDEAAAVIETLAKQGASAPVAENITVGWILSDIDRSIGPGVHALAVVDRAVQDRGDQTMEIAWAELAESVTWVTEASLGSLVVTTETPQILGTTDVFAGAPRNRVRIPQLSAHELHRCTLDFEHVQGRMSLWRSLMTIGAAERALVQTIHYAQQREQFGRALARFPVIQNMLAFLATQVRTAKVLIHDSVTSGGVDPRVVSAGRVAVGRAARETFRVAHQVHGAIGFTAEYPLSRTTLTMLELSDDYGTEATAGRDLGTRVLTADPDDLWELLTTIPSR